jgi:ferritin-like metal-binding protein YciE
MHGLGPHERRAGNESGQVHDIPGVLPMAGSQRAKELYLTGLRNQHAVEAQAIETIERELGRMEPHPELHERMREEIRRSQTQQARLEAILSGHGTSPSTAKETVTSVVGKVAGMVHLPASDEVIKDLLAAIGYKAYEVGSYKALVTLARTAGAPEDVEALEQSMKEEMEMAGWQMDHLPGIVEAFIRRTEPASR